MNFSKHISKPNKSKSFLTPDAFFFQPKLTINQPNDIYEQEADAIADKVMRMPSNKNENIFFKPANISSLQRKCTHCEEEEKLQMKSEGNAGSGIEAPSIVHDVINKGGQPLDTGTRNFFESRFGHDFSNVRIHNDSMSAQSAQSSLARHERQRDAEHDPHPAWHHGHLRRPVRLTAIEVQTASMGPRPRQR